MKYLFILLLLINAPAIRAQDYALYKKYFLVQDEDTIPFRVLFPKEFDPAKKYPVLFFLHGVGERGNDNEKQLLHGAAVFLQEEVRNKFPAFIVFPQCSNNSYWSNVVQVYDSSKKRSFHFLTGGPETKAMRLLQQLVPYVIGHFGVDQRRVYIGGLSMGGMGTFEMVRRNPSLFTAAFVICGGADPQTAKYLSKTHWWLFHGLKDNVVDPSLTIEMNEALKRKKADVRMTLYPNDNHNSWDHAFAEKDLLPWLFSKSK